MQRILLDSHGQPIHINDSR